MNEDQLLKKLAEQARREGRDDLDPRWDALAAGELGDDERRRLIEQDPDGVRKGAAFDPLPGDFREAMKADIRKRVLASHDAPAVAPGKVPKRWLGALAAGLLAAVAVVLLLPRAPTYEALPGYSSTLRGGSVMRSENEERPVFVPGDRIELILTPATAVTTTLDARAFIMVDNAAEPLALPAPQWSEFGAARIVATVGADLMLPAGDSVLVVAIGHPGGMPGESEVVARLTRKNADAADGWQLLEFSLHVEAR